MAFDQKAYNKAYRAKHREELVAYARHFYQNNKEKWTKRTRHREGRDKTRNAVLLRKYGITLDQYRILLKQQNYCCAICKGRESLKGRDWCVDHCHESGAVRGILCHRCNVALGMFNDDLERVAAALSYLERSKRNVSIVDL